MARPVRPTQRMAGPTSSVAGHGAPTWPTLLPLERAVLELLVQQSSGCPNAVVLAEQVWLTRDAALLGGDPAGLVGWVLQELNAKGLVTYRLPMAVGPGHDVPQMIRITAQGAAAVGHPLAYRRVGDWHRQRDPSAHPGDRTDYANHRHTTSGGPIEHAPLRQHMSDYPDHAAVHRRQLAELENDPMGTAAPRGRPRVTSPEIDTYILDQAAAGIPSATIAKGVDTLYGVHLTAKTVQRRIYGRPDQGHDTTAGLSLKEVVLQVVRSCGVVADGMDLPHLLAKAGRRADLHEINHVLNSLQKDGKVTFMRHQQGSVQRYNKIQAVQAKPVPFYQPVEPTVVTPAEVTAISVPTPNYPELARLREAEANYRTAHAKAERLLAAAEALHDVDEASASALLERAAVYDAEAPMTPLELEYLAYAAATEGRPHGGE